MALLCMLAAACASRPAPKSSETEQGGRNFYKVGAPYQIAGVWYYPAVDFSYDETGIASWYGEAFHAKTTANGEVFDLNALTAAHRTLPLPSIVQVTNLDNGRVVELRVNDRGPFASNRIIDISRRGAQLLGFEQTGTAKVRVRILTSESIQAASLAKLNGSPDQLPVETPRAAPRDQVVAMALAPNGKSSGAATATQASPPAAPVAAAPAQPAIVPPGPPLPNTVMVVPVRPSSIYVQAGAFTRVDNAAQLKARLSPLGAVAITSARVGGIDFFRVRIGPVASVDQADALLTKVSAVPGAAEAKIVVD
ncbi:MAG TPA: septal ring lytic transglycosylase RlpA family protein [Stellaceae bacterium]|nr:septal ring lytic transglycosylase RlpA family protein [Stellaceae bacterium]